MKLRAIQHPGHAGELLDSYIRHAEKLPGDSHRLMRGAELTPALEKIAQRAIEEGAVWQARTDDREMWLWTCEVSLARSRERGMPVIEVRRYDESGAVEESGTWVLVRLDSWQRCNE